MKKVFSVLGLGLLLGLMLMPQAARADLAFTNGGFEAGNLSGWTIGYGDRNQGSETVNWGGAYNANGSVAGVVGVDGKVATVARGDNGSLPLG